MGKVLTYKTGKLGQMTYNNGYYGDSAHTANIAWTDTGGNAKTSVYYGARTDGIAAFTTPSSVTQIKGLFPSSDTFENSSYTDYAINQVSGVSISYSAPTELMTDDTAIAIYSILLTNSGSESATINSLKNVFALYTDANGGKSSALSWGYFFDTPITLNAGESKNIVIKIAY